MFSFERAQRDNKVYWHFRFTILQSVIYSVKRFGGGLPTTFTSSIVKHNYKGQVWASTQVRQMDGWMGVVKGLLRIAEGKFNWVWIFIFSIDWGFVSGIVVMWVVSLPRHLRARSRTASWSSRRQGRSPSTSSGTCPTRKSPDRCTPSRPCWWGTSRRTWTMKNALMRLNGLSRALI